jgi:hypothetical protein
MKRRPRIYFTSKQKSEIWDRWQRGTSMSSIGRGFNRDSSSIHPLLSRAGGIFERHCEGLPSHSQASLL